jgi:dolichol-phosphate mannosyltransferase
MKRLVLTATYNEAENIEWLIAQVRGHGYDTLVVDDRGTDDTAARVRARQANDDRVFLISHERRGGYAAASRAGLAWAIAEGYEQVAQLDADGSHDPARLPVLFRALEETDLAIGSRYVLGGAVPGLSGFRRLLSDGAGAYVRHLVGARVGDPTSGYRAWRVPFLRRVLPKADQTTGFAFLYELLFHVVQAGGTIHEIPIRFDRRRAGESKMNWAIAREALGLSRRLRSRG